MSSGAPKVWESSEAGESSALDLAELLEKKDLSAAEVRVIRQNMVQVCYIAVSSLPFTSIHRKHFGNSAPF